AGPEARPMSTYPRRGMRLLPFVIVTLAALITVRVAALVIGIPLAQESESAVGLPIVPSAVAARNEPAPPRAAASQPPAGATAPSAPGGEAVAAATPRFAQPSAAELTVLEDLRARRLALDERERTLGEREAVVVAAE